MGGKGGFTSKCLVASSFRDIRMSLVRMLRKCMSLRRVARFTVVSLVDCGDKEVWQRNGGETGRRAFAGRTHQHDELVRWRAVEDAVCSDGFPEVFVNAVVCTAVKKEKPALMQTSFMKTEAERFHAEGGTLMQRADSHVPQVFWDGDGDFVKSVSRGRGVGVQRSDPLRCDDLVVCGVARRIFDYVELEAAEREAKTPFAHTLQR